MRRHGQVALTLGLVGLAALLCRLRRYRLAERVLRTAAQRPGGSPASVGWHGQAWLSYLSATGHLEDRQRAAGLQATERILFSLSAPAPLKVAARRNSFYYLYPFPVLVRCDLAFELPQIPGSPQRYRPLNPSIVQTPDGYRVICRTVNYVNDRGLWYHSLANDKVVRTRNYYLTLNPAAAITRVQEIVDGAERQTYPTGVMGFEDCRLFRRSGPAGSQAWFSCTVSDSQPKFLPQMALARMPAEAGTGDNVTVRQFELLKGPKSNRSEKNWLPFEKDSCLRLLYSFDPVTIIAPDGDAMHWRSIRPATRLYDCATFRGGAGPIAFDGGYLAIVHEVWWQGYRRYLHRFVWLDADFGLRMVTPRFYFVRPTIEFCCGLCHAHEKDEVLAGVGLEDSQAALFRISGEAIRARLAPPGEPSRVGLG